MIITFPQIVSLIAVTICLLYIFQIWKWHLRWNHTPEYHPKLNLNKQLPSISILVAFRNEAKQLPQLLASLANQKTNNWELILIDDHSTDNSIDIINNLQSKIPAKVKLLTNSGTFKKNALRTGANVAEGEYLLMTDADCILPDNWIITYQNWFQDHATDLTIGPVQLIGKDTVLNRFQFRDFHALQISGAAAAINNKAIMCNGANMACRKKLFLKANLKNEFASGDDMFLLEWMKKHNHDINYLKSSDALVKTNTEESWNDFFSQRARWAAKAKGYTDKNILLIGLLVSLCNIFLLLFLIWGMFNPFYLVIWLFLFTIKTAMDYYFLRTASYFWPYRDNLPEFTLSQFLYPIYLLLTLAYPLFKPVKWKNRSL